MRNLAQDVVDAIASLHLEPVPLTQDEDALSGRQVCAVMAAPDQNRRRLRLCVSTDFSTFTSAEYSPGAWVDLDAETASLDAEAQHTVLRQALGEAARLWPVAADARAVPFSLLVHPNDTANELVSVALGDQQRVLAVISTHEMATVTIEALVWQETGVLVVGLDGAGFGLIRQRVEWSALKDARVGASVTLTADSFRGQWLAQKKETGRGELEAAARVLAEHFKPPVAASADAELERLLALHRKDLGSVRVDHIAQAHGLEFLERFVTGLAGAGDGRSFAQLCSYAMELLIAGGHLRQAAALATLPKGKDLNWVDFEQVFLLLRLGEPRQAADALKGHLQRRGTADARWLMLRAVVAFHNGLLEDGKGFVAELEKTPRSAYAAIAAAFDPSRNPSERGNWLQKARRWGFGGRTDVADAVLALAEQDPALAPHAIAERQRMAEVKAAHEALTAAFKQAKPVFGPNTKLEEASGPGRSIWKDSDDGDEEEDDDGSRGSGTHRYRFAGEVKLVLENGEYPRAMTAKPGVLVMGTSAGRLLGYRLEGANAKPTWVTRDVGVGPGHSLALNDGRVFAADEDRGLTVLQLEADAPPKPVATLEPRLREPARLVFSSGPRVAAVGSSGVELFEGLEPRGLIDSDDAIRGAAFCGQWLAVTHQNLAGVALYDVSNLAHPRRVDVMRLQEEAECRFIHALGTRLLVRCDNVLWLLDCADGRLRHVATLPMRFASSESWPDVRLLPGDELVMADTGYRRAISVLSLANEQLAVVDVLPFEGNHTCAFGGVALVGDDAWGFEGDAGRYRLLCLQRAG